MIGFINVNKPSGMTSNAVISRIKRILTTKQRIGHMGTLDPMACGVLPVAIGKATRMFDYFLDKEKRYSAIFEFGYETDTLDKEGQTTSSTKKIPSLKEIEKVLPEFTGEIDQIPPQYSAKSVDGVRAYKLARQGKTVDLQPKRIKVYEIKVFCNDEKSYRFEIQCSSGTYVRSICRDIAHRLDSLATMTYLQRTESGNFKISEAINIDDLTIDKVKTIIMPIERVFSKFATIQVNSDYLHKLANGITVTLKDAKDGKFFIKNGDFLLGVGEVLNGELKIVTNLADDTIMQTEE